jgi:hypothetical protein
MSNTSNKTSIEEFLSLMTGSKEVGLAIAKNQTELEKFSKAMDSFDFKKSENVADLLKTQKTYLIVDHNIDKNIYDFVVQYSSGQVEIFDKKLMQSQTLSPDYKNSAIVLLVDQDNLNKIQAKGFDLLSASGPAYRS